MTIRSSRKWFYKLQPYFLIMFILTGCISETKINQTSTQNSQDAISLMPIANFSGIASSEIYTFTCELIEQRPTTSTRNCADFGEVVFDIEWRTWDATSGSGIGTFSVNNCIPNCAEGRSIDFRAKVRLDGLKTDGKRFFLTDFTYVLERNSHSEISITGGWDNSDYYLSNFEMRE